MPTDLSIKAKLAEQTRKIANLKAANEALQDEVAMYRDHNYELDQKLQKYKGTGWQFADDPFKEWYRLHIHTA